MSAALSWLDLYVEGDTHPRRFDGPAALRQYLSKVERLGEESIMALLSDGQVAPPLSRRQYRLQALGEGE
ncbi:hypothetical protein [Deinococcus sp.]|uniref:hypothetical protein n=1 Tax=Deinococcus sp. TaxID=47478 RepID=UPI003B58E4D1